ncbi:hypothetical protein TWF730_007128 [Orbilia blumenaviensis]|uniref:Uncharacterized protein n=1 Tax=Orbilia blumenaviensis TaxID=1796055 RepID=A0AAV9VGT1_9PEZI
MPLWGFILWAPLIAFNNIRGSSAAATFLEGFFASDRSPYRGSVFSLCYGIKAMGSIVSLADNKGETCETFGGLSFWQAQREAPKGKFSPDFEYYSFDTIGGDSIMILEDKTRSALKIAGVGRTHGFQKAVFTNMIPRSIAGDNRGLKPGDHLVLVGSVRRSGQYKLEGGAITGLGDEPRGVFYTTKRAIGPMTMALRVAQDPSNQMDDLPVYEDSYGIDIPDEPANEMKTTPLEPVTDVWEWAGLGLNPSTGSEPRHASIPEIGEETSNDFIEFADWSTGNRREDFNLRPPKTLQGNSYKLPAGFRYAQTQPGKNNPHTEETLHNPDPQISPYQSTEERSRVLGESYVAEKLFLDSQGETTLDSSNSQLNLGSVPYTPPSYGNAASMGMLGNTDEGMGIPMFQPFNPLQSFESALGQQPKKKKKIKPIQLRREARRKAEREAAQAEKTLSEIPTTEGNVPD